MQLALPFRSRARAIVVIAMALALILGTLAAPARAGEDHDDLEAARGAALEKVTHKIDSLRECRESAETDAAWAIYSEGIQELGGIKERIAGEDNVYEINVLKERAVAIWAETKELAARADDEGRDDDEGDKEDDDGKEEEDDEGDEEDDEAAEDEERRGHEEEQRRKDQEIAEAKLSEARVGTLSLIEKKVRLLNAASRASQHHQVSDIYRRAATAIEELLLQAREAESIEALDAIRGEVWEIIHQAKKEIAAYRPGHDKDGDGVTDEDEGTDGDGDEGTEGEDGTDDGEEGTEGGAEEDDGAEEEATILAALNATELEIDNWQIAIQNTMSLKGGIGFPEGPIALTAGDSLLDAIDAARLLTGDELALAWADILDQRGDYLRLVMAYDREYRLGWFSNEVVPT